MADASDTRAEAKEEKSEEAHYDPRLDFFSDHFDPLLALTTPGIVPPVANANEHDNLQAYENVWVKGTVAVPKKTVESAAVGERRWLPHQCKLKRAQLYKIKLQIYN